MGGRRAQLAGAVLGAGIAVATIVMALPAAGHGGVPAARLEASALSTGPVSASAGGPAPFLRAAGLRPAGRARTARLELVNESGARLAVRLRARLSSTALDGLVRLRLRAGRRVVFDATLSELRAAGTRPFWLPREAHRSLQATAWIPGEVETGYEGRVVRLELIPAVGREAAE